MKTNHYLVIFSNHVNVLIDAEDRLDAVKRLAEKSEFYKEYLLKYDYKVTLVVDKL